MTSPGTPSEPVALRALRVVAVLEGLSFVVLLVGSLLKRTTDTDPVPVLGPVHGVLFVAVVLLVLANLRRLRWGPVFTAAMLTVGSPGVRLRRARDPRAAGAGPRRADSGTLTRALLDSGAHDSAAR